MSTAAGLQVTSQTTEQGLRVTVVGELDLASAPRLSTALAPEAVQGASEVVLDLERVSFIDSSALRALVVAGRNLAEAGIKLQIGPRSEVVARVLEITQLDQQTEAFQVLPEPT